MYGALTGFIQFTIFSFQIWEVPVKTSNKTSAEYCFICIKSNIILLTSIVKCYIKIIMQTNRKAKMSRIRLNQEYRNKIANRMRVHLEQEDTQEKQKYDELKANQNIWIAIILCFKFITI